MPSLKAIIFDLDGTLVDSARDLQDATNALLAEEGLRPISLDEVKSMIGDGAAKLVERAFAATGGDGTHLPELVAMVAERGCDIAIGSRLARGSKTDRQLKREITSRGYVALIRMTFPRLKISDAQCGFKALNRRAVEATAAPRHARFRAWVGHLQGDSWLRDGVGPDVRRDRRRRLRGGLAHRRPGA